MRERARLEFTPQWDGPIKGWARSFITKNKWRCDPIYDLDDLMNDAYIVFCKVADYYPEAREPAHFMSLFQTALRNEIHNYSRKMHDRQGTFCDMDVAAVPDFCNFGYVAAVLAKVPAEVQSALAVYLDEFKLVELTKETKRTRFSRKTVEARENLNDKLSRLAGLPESYDVVAELRRLFT